MNNFRVLLMMIKDSTQYDLYYDKDHNGKYMTELEYYESLVKELEIQEIKKNKEKLKYNISKIAFFTMAVIIYLIFIINLIVNFDFIIWYPFVTISNLALGSIVTYNIIRDE
jgi:nitrate reductase NapE component